MIILTKQIMNKYKNKSFFKDKYLQNIFIKEIFTLYPQENLRIPNKYFIFLFIYVS